MYDYVQRGAVSELEMRGLCIDAISSVPYICQLLIECKDGSCIIIEAINIVTTPDAIKQVQKHFEKMMVM